jgi:hypothetical protein
MNDYLYLRATIRKARKDRQNSTGYGRYTQRTRCQTGKFKTVRGPETGLPAARTQFETLFAIEIVGIPKYDDCSIEVHPCRGTSGYTDRGYSTDA